MGGENGKEEVGLRPTTRWGAPFVFTQLPRFRIFPHPTVNSTDAKTFYPHGLRPWDGEWEEPTGTTLASLSAIPVGKKQQGSAPHQAGGCLLFLLGRNGHDGSVSASPDPLLLAPDPFSLAHRTPDTAQPGQLRAYYSIVFRFCVFLPL